MSDKSTTPRPWKHGEGLCEHKVYSANPNAKHKDELARCYGDAHNEGAANAELICKVVNQYDHVAELVEAAQASLYWIAAANMECHAARERLRSALSKFEDAK